jgi:hypothetical protein
LTLDPAKQLDIDAVEGALDDLLEHYRQALRAVELLPSFGRLPDNECTVQIAQPVSPTRSRIRRLKTPSLRSRTRHGRYSAVRRFVRMFLRSHIRSKLRTIADRLEIERFASGHMDANTLKRLDNTIRKLRDCDRSLIQGRIFGSKLQGWIWRIWPVAAPVLLTYLTTLGISRLRVVGLLGYIITYMLYLALAAWLPLFTLVGEGGFRWKRLILLGQTGDTMIYRPNAVLRWVPGPQANTYEAENRLFGTLGLPKPDEFPWDFAFWPQIFLLAPLALSFFVLAIDIGSHAKGLGWPIIITIVLFGLSLLCLEFILRSISRAKRERRQRNAC